MTDSNEPYKCLSVSKELSLCFEPGEDKIHISVKNFIEYSKSELSSKDQNFLCFCWTICKWDITKASRCYSS